MGKGPLLKASFSLFSLPHPAPIFFLSLAHTHTHTILPIWDWWELTLFFFFFNRKENIRAFIHFWLKVQQSSCSNPKLIHWKSQLNALKLTSPSHWNCPFSGNKIPHVPLASWTLPDYPATLIFLCRNPHWRSQRPYSAWTASDDVKITNTSWGNLRFMGAALVGIFPLLVIESLVIFA